MDVKRVGFFGKINNKRRIKIKQKALLVGLVGAIFFVIVLIMAIRKNFFENFILGIQDTVGAFSANGNGFPVEMEGNSVLPRNLSVINDNITVLNDRFFECFSKSGGAISRRAHNFSNPGMKSCASKAILYNIGGKDYSIETCSKRILEGESAGRIISCDISENGTYVLLCDSVGYLGQIEVFGADKKQKYKYNFSDFYATDVSLSNDGKGVAVCGFYSRGGSISSVINFFDFNSLEPIITYESTDNMVTCVHCMENKNLIAFGDKSAVFVNPWKDEKKELSYNSKILKCLDIDKNLGVCYFLSFSSSDKGGTVIYLDKYGNIKSQLDLENNFEDVLLFNNKIVGLSKRNLFVYDFSGNIKEKQDINDVALAVCKCPWSTSVFVLLKNNINKIDIY